MAIPHSPKLRFPRRNVLDIVFLGLNRAPGLEHQRPQPLLRQLLRGPAARHSGTDYNRVVGRFMPHWLSGPSLPTRASGQTGGVVWGSRALLQKRDVDDES